MRHRDRVITALNHKITDRPPFQATFTPEFANRLRIEFRLPEKQTEPHHRQWYGYDLEMLTGQDALQAGVGWFTNYYLKNIPYTDEWGVQWRIDEYKTPIHFPEHKPVNTHYVNEIVEILENFFHLDDL